MRASRRIFSLLLLLLAAAPTAAAPSKSKSPVVELDTSKGKIRLELDAKKAPVTVKNFLAYVESGHYNGTIFHRVIAGFMIQGGGVTADMTDKQTRPPIKNEAVNGLKNARGTIAMARKGDPDSATSQFFINLVDNGGLDRPNPDGHGYTVFGKVVSGMDVVDKIAAVSTTSRGGHENVPAEAVVIRSAKVVAKRKR